MNIMKKLFVLLILFLVLGCIQTRNFSDSFTVDYYSKYASSGGDRILDISYRVESGEIVWCEGTYSYPPSQEQQDQGIYTNNVEQCDVERLKSKNYNAPVKLITEITGGRDLKMPLTQEGPGSYSWEVVFE